MATTRFTLTGSAWTALATGPASVLVQQVDYGTTFLSTGVTQPASTATAVQLEADNDDGLLLAVPSGETLWARSSAESGLVVVMQVADSFGGSSSGLTNDQLRAEPVPISGTVTANTGLSQPLTNDQLRAAPVSIVGTTVIAMAAFTRPADTTAYASGDLVANSTTAGAVAPMQFTVARVAQGTGAVRRVRLRKSGTSITNAVFRLHLYRAAPTPSNGDNGAWITNQSAAYLGAFDVTMDRVFTDGAAGNGVPLAGSEILFKAVTGQLLYGLIEARGAYTPASGETFTVELEAMVD